MVGLLCGALAGLLATPALRAVIAPYAVPGRYAVALAAGAVGAAVGWGAHWPALPVLGWLALLGVPLAFIDLAVFRLPDRLTLPLALGTAALLLLVEHRQSVLLRCLWAALLLAGVFALLALVAPLGLGDAKLALTLGLALGWYGWPTVYAGILYAFLLLGVWGGALRLTRRIGKGAELPFGPHLLLGTLLAALVAG